MKILSRYILRSFLSSFLLTGLVLTFVLSIGFLFKVVTFLTRGAAFAAVGKYLLASIPEVLGFTIPLALLISALLVFGRMSSDSEISAMRACGVSFWRIQRWPLIVAILCSAFGFVMQHEVMPRGHYVRRVISNQLAMDVGIQMMDPGRFVDEVNQFSVFCARRDGNTLYHVMALDRRDPEVIREIRAERADLTLEGSDLIFNLTKAQISPPPGAKHGTVTSETFSYRCADSVSRTRKYTRKEKDLYFWELVQRIRQFSHPVEGVSDEFRAKLWTKALFIINYRTVWALAAICFVLVGVPLGIQGQRKENSRGMLFSLIIGLAFFLFLMLSESLSDKPMAFPYIIVWIPVLLSIGTSIYLIKKQN